ncbi:MAG: class I SAM-dependent methyltransferase [Planctomycetota bacterium]|jgi:hypothetical protein
MGLFNKLSYISRQRKLKLFYELFCPTEQLRILDVGAQISDSSKNQVQFIDSYPWKHRISAINLLPEHISLIKNRYPEIDAVVGDACNLPWPDNYFDIVYSNAVIEHVGDLKKQKKMADEIMRVGKQWFVTTPNRWYPFEFHMRLPLVTWLPGDLYLQVGRLISFNHVTARYTLFSSKSSLRLMSAEELKRCFNNNRIIKQVVTFMAETLIAVSDCSRH